MGREREAQWEKSHLKDASERRNWEEMQSWYPGEEDVRVLYIYMVL